MESFSLSIGIIHDYKLSHADVSCMFVMSKAMGVPQKVTPPGNDEYNVTICSIL